MATCITSINNQIQPVELSTGVVYPAVIDKNVNALYILANDLDQSVFFNIRVVGIASNISFTLTIYNETTLAVFGSVQVKDTSISTSFNIAAGRYYVCIRSQVLTYNIELTPRFISYSKSAIFTPRSYYGASSEGTIVTSRPPGLCNRRLLYTLIEGELPKGLTLLDNGYISGFLPILDVDEYNKDLPPSNTWYHQIADSEYVTNWGRAYRFRVHLTLFDDRTTEDIRWFYIAIVNNYSKNQALIDTYTELDDDRSVTFEERVKLDTIRLCPPLPCELVVDSDTVLSDSPVPLTIEQLIVNSNNANDISSDATRALYEAVELNKNIDDNAELNDNIMMYPHLYNDVDMDQLTEQLPIPNMHDILIQSDTDITFANMGIVDYYVDRFDEYNNILIDHLKDSCMFQWYLKENNIAAIYIIDDVLSRDTYNNVILTYSKITDERTKIDSYYINMYVSGNNISIDIKDEFTDRYQDNYNKLPLTSYSFIGFDSVTRLTVPGK